MKKKRQAVGSISRVEGWLTFRKINSFKAFFFNKVFYDIFSLAECEMFEKYGEWLGLQILQEFSKFKIFSGNK